MTSTPPANVIQWLPDDFIVVIDDPGNIGNYTERIYELTCRTDFSSPGFCMIDAGNRVTSSEFRRLMVTLKESLAGMHVRKTGSTLVYLSMARFDQQESTKPHLDGGPEECFLMLGYEPSEVAAEITILDYARCAHDLGLSPNEFLAKHNPMFGNADVLQPYATPLPKFRESRYYIVCVNNSSRDAGLSNYWQGNLHTATITTPDETRRRIIDSTMIATADISGADQVTPEDQLEFITTSVVLRRGYDKPHLVDDD